MTKTMLERLGCVVTPFTDPIEALKGFASDPGSFDLFVTDQTMAAMTGIALAREVLSIRDDIPIILCTGYSETISDSSVREAGIRAFVMKPITKKEMSEAIGRLLGRGEGGKAL